jgi:lipid II:glycine glycyltransferase (peptidoglycan interpeptide bridge formation enzyme)
MASRGVASVLGGGTAGAGYPREATTDELADWDRRVVEAPGGHVYQSRAWAAERAKLGWRPLHVLVDADHAALVLTRPFPLVGGASAYVPRGPIVDVSDPTDGGEAAARRVTVLTDWLRGRGVAVVATDAEVPATDQAYGRALRAAGFRTIPEIQPSRHRVSIALARDTDDAAVLAGIAKGTRQRIAGAERGGIVVERHDTAGWPSRDPLFEKPSVPTADAFAGFATLLEGTGERLGFTFGPRQVFIDWWVAAHAAGLLVYLEAHDRADRDANPLGGLILYRHGDRLSTVHSADAPGVRETHPGVMHLLRWRAIQLAIREGCTEMDLGGVDVAPDHREPQEGEPMAGLYEHKRSFGATWVEMTGAHERVMTPWRYAAGRLAARVARLARPAGDRRA